LTLPAQYAVQVYITVRRPSVRPSVCPIIRPQQRRAAFLLLNAMPAGVDETSTDRAARSAATAPQHGAAARRSAANAGSDMLTAEITRLNAELLIVMKTKQAN